MQCRKCGAHNPDWNAQQSRNMLRFCVKCGEQLDPPQADARYSAETASAAAAAATAAVNASGAANPAGYGGYGGYGVAPAGGYGGAPSGGYGGTPTGAYVPRPGEAPGGTVIIPPDPGPSRAAPGGWASDSPAGGWTPDNASGGWTPSTPHGDTGKWAAVGGPGPGGWTPPTPPKPKKSGPKLGLILGIVGGIALLIVLFFTVHIWKPATCTTPEKCALCGITRGEANGHDWQDATCTEPKTCAACGETMGAALGHAWQDATCTVPKKCSRCGETEGSALGHLWLDATYDAPKTCERCGETTGTVLGWVGSVSGDFSDTGTTIEGNDGHAFVFTNPIVNCYRMTAHFRMTEYTGSPFGTFAIYAHSASRGWFRAATFQVSSSDVNQDMAVPITFSEGDTIDSVMPVCTLNATYNFSYSFYVNDVQTK